jgi:hypothetical protein
VSRDWRLYLDDIVEYAGRALRYCEGLTYEQFLDDSRTFDAALRCLETVGYAVENWRSTSATSHPRFRGGRSPGSATGSRTAIRTWTTKSSGRPDSSRSRCAGTRPTVCGATRPSLQGSDSAVSALLIRPYARHEARERLRGQEHGAVSGHGGEIR